MRGPILYGMSLNNTPDRVNTEELAKFTAAEVQFEFWRTYRNQNGDTFSPDGSPAARYLYNQGVDPWVYIDLQFTDRDMIGYATLPPEDDPYWFRVERAKKLEERDWWLHCVDGSVSDHYWGGLSPSDVSNPEFRAWAVGRVLEILEPLPVKQLRFDNVFSLDFERYIYCDTPLGVSEYVAGLCAMFDELRAHGVTIVANMAWAMANPYAPPEDWVFPFMEHVDGVMFERGTGLSLPHRSLAARRMGMRQWWSADMWLPEISRAWLDAGKAFIYMATLTEEESYSWPGGLEQFAASMWQQADELGYDVAINSRHEHYGNTPWFDFYPNQKGTPLFPLDPDPEPEPDPDPNLEARVSNLESIAYDHANRIAALESKFC